MRPSHMRTTASSLRWLALTSALALAASLEGCASVRSHAVGAPAATVSAPVSSGATDSATPKALVDASEDVHTQGQAAAKANALLGTLRLPPTSKPAAASSTAQLERSTYNLGTTPTHLMATKWWTTQQSAADALQFLRSYPPRGFQLSGDGNSSSVEQLQFQPSGQHTGRTMIVWQLVPRSGGSALRADAVVVWVPPASPLTHVPATVTSAVVAVGPSEPLPGQPGTVATKATLTAGKLNRLVEAFNALTPYVESGSAGCEGAGPSASVEFRFPGHKLAFHWLANDCSRIYASYDGKPDSTLVGNPLPLVERLLDVKLLPFK
jgi:hypothetical protein